MARTEWTKALESMTENEFEKATGSLAVIIASFKPLDRKAQTCIVNFLAEEFDLPIEKP